MTLRAYIVAAGGANYGSLREACRRIDVDTEIGDDPARIRDATHVILPGVGAAAHAMRALRERGLDRVLAQLAQPLLGICLGMQLLFESSEECDAPKALSPELARERGSGEGMGAREESRIARSKADGDDAGCASASCAALQTSHRAPAPHSLSREKPPAERETVCLGVLAGRVQRLSPAPSWPHMGWNTLEQRAAHPLLAGIDDQAWFYFVHGYAVPVGADTLASTQHDERFASVIAHANVHGVQFHPEKSAAAGRRVLANFFALT